MTFKIIVTSQSKNDPIRNRKNEITIAEQLEGISSLSLATGQILNSAQNNRNVKKGKKLFPENPSNYPIITTKLNEKEFRQVNPGKPNIKCYKKYSLTNIKRLISIS